MIPWSLLDTAQVPGGGEIRLKQRGTEFAINAGSERTDEQPAQRLRGGAGRRSRAGKSGDRKAPRILIGGLGMGFTPPRRARRARDRTPPDRRR
jgi:hypothetical protein